MCRVFYYRKIVFRGYFVDRSQIAGLPTVFYRQELCERLGAQIMREVA